ncbi:hypothetical protein BDS110ZK4_13460 [Bradyrhizobium diazoefficiens]|uniref:Uncharacterized protein n=3 Tax=Nitrobacteraceae TaxID=41294 RepID=A0A809ZD28_9BRAD|nr:hypothetical protein BD122_20630 [Bradyrhizobium diazoefficiens]BCE24116.1 hypothetical protein XF1B_67970 [Bradyrhizobium diazoefficiens]BCE50372.1 hypothetical protein XF4B_67210 [Bradyrhizobium diazoefficiens]BCE93879.1 hypothetical protein XF10B_66770 [Bradyrhizobium diazoefficiens]BCF28817.1 hypothetical protein XF14B_67690 [Bradyrhizobium diazoefficiens]
MLAQFGRFKLTMLRDPLSGMLSLGRKPFQCAGADTQGAELMPIYRLLQNLPMGPEEVNRMTTAFDKALRTIGIKDRSDPMAEMIAKKIVEIAQTGVRDPAEISAQAIRELGM